MKFDHIVIHADSTEQVQSLKEKLNGSGLPYEPSWGKKAKGFQVSNIWIGRQYFEIVDILQSDNRWQPNWSERHARGDRGTFCVFMKTTVSIDRVFQALNDADIQVSQPERTTFKWFFNLLEKKLPWRFLLTSKIPGTNIELGFIEYDDGAEEKFAPYMVPNSSDNGITGISHATLFSEDLDSANLWLDKIQQALKTEVGLSLASKTDDPSVKLDVETFPGVDFAEINVMDVLLQSSTETPCPT